MKRIFLTLVLMVVIYSSCAQQGEQQPREPESSGALSASENAAMQTDLRVPSEFEVQELLALQDQIMKNPEEIALRRALGEKAIVVEAGVVWSIGRGKISLSARPLNVAQSQAELAARIDAARWAAYLSTWHKSDFGTPFGAMKAEVSGGEVVKKILTDSTCTVLLKTPLE